MLNVIRSKLYWLTAWTRFDRATPNADDKAYPSIPPSETDPGYEQLHYSENFRKAKRNVLFWAGVTALLSIGRVRDDKDIEITAIVRNLEFDQLQLISGALLALVFMMLGYIKAEQRLVAEHTEFSFGKGLVRETDRIVGIKLAIDDINKQADEYLEQVHSLVREAKGLRTTGSDDPHSRRLIEEIELLSSSQGLKTDALESFRSDIGRFSTRIGGAEILWFQSYDRGVVYLAFAVSFLMGLSKFVLFGT